MVKARNTKHMMEKKELCNRKRGANLEVETEFKSKRALVTREAVKYYRTTGGDYKPLVEELMKDIPLVSEKTRELQRNEVLDIVDRYIKYDNRSMQICYPKYFHFDGEQLMSRPDFMIESEVEILNKKRTNVEKVPMVELFLYTTGNQNYTNSNKCGRSKEFISIHHNLETLGLLMYGIEVLNGRKGIVKIYFDSLKTSRDKYGDYSEEFEEAKTDSTGTKTCNRIWMQVLINKNKKIIRDTNYCLTNNENRKLIYDNRNLFKNYKETMEIWRKGVEPDSCSNNTCAECEMYEICNYNHRPQKKEEEHIKKQMSDYSTTKQQKTIVDYKDGISIVNAGPGSGKTFSVVLRVVNLLYDGVKPEDICLLSFSKAAVEVLLQRIKEMVEDVYMLPIDTSKIKIATFNSIGNEIIQDRYEELGFKEKPELIDDVESYDLIMKSIDWDDEISCFDYKNPHMKLGDIKGVGKDLEEIFAEISMNNYSEDDFIQKSRYTTTDSQKIWNCYTRYKNLMKENNFIDYADQTNMVEKIMEDNYGLISSNLNFPHIICDEYQDSNDFQFNLIMAMINSVKFESLMVVGDDAQGIYGFRGTSVDGFLNFDKKIGGKVDKLFLTVNHRSCEEIVVACNDIIKLNTKRVDKTMTSSRGNIGKKPILKGFEKPDLELEYVSNKIKELIDSGEKPEDIAFISFSKANLRKLSKKLSDMGILSQYDMPEEMLTNSRVKAAIGLMRYAKELTETKGLMIYLNELYGNTFINRLDQINKMVYINNESFSEIYVPMSIDEKKEYLLKLLEVIDDGTDNVYTQFLEKLKGKTKYSVLELIDYVCKFEDYNSSSSANKDGTYSAVSLVTAHSSKGKEWKYVFGSLSDFDNSHLKKTDDIEERRRVIFVMCSRAKDELTVTSCIERKDNSDEQKPLNRFYKELRNLDSFDVNPI